MLIHPPSITQIGSEIQISARIEFQNKRRSLPSTLWFRFPSNFSSQVSLDCDPFVVSLLLLAMQNQEPIQILGPVSEKLLIGLSNYQEIYHSWYPDRFHKIDLLPTELRKTEPLMDQKNSGIACAFSGGVDSFYTLLDLSGHLKPSRHPKLTHAVFMAGFDMPLNLKASIQELTQSYSTLMQELGIQFVVGSTNIRNFVNTVDWTNAHGQALGATALFFKSVWKQFFIPSSYVEDTHPKWGTHPRLDPLLSTESLEFIHHGVHANRIEKLAAIVQFPMTYERLRVCWIQDIGLQNCGECEKCIRTMIALDILDSLPHYTSFGKNRTAPTLNRVKIRQLTQRTYQARLFARELWWAAFKRRKFRTCLDLSYSLARRKVVRLMAFKK